MYVVRTHKWQAMLFSVPFIQFIRRFGVCGARNNTNEPSKSIALLHGPMVSVKVETMRQA